MKAYWILFFAVIAEIIATSSLKMSHGFSKLVPSMLVVAGYSCAFFLMGIALKTLPVGILYSLWAGLGILGIVFIAVFYFKEPFTYWHLFGTSLIIAGTVILCMVTKSH